VGATRLGRSTGVGVRLPRPTLNRTEPPRPIHGMRSGPGCCSCLERPALLMGGARLEPSVDGCPIPLLDDEGCESLSDFVKGDRPRRGTPRQSQCAFDPLV
jgi:hypothetical protein